MDTYEIKRKYDELSSELKQVVSRMERSDRVFAIRDQIKDLQHLCPHTNGGYDFSDAEFCPYCGKRMKG